MVKGRAAGDDIKTFAGKRQRLYVGRLEAGVQKATCRPLRLGALQHGGGYIHADDFAHTLGKRECHKARTGCDIEDEGISGRSYKGNEGPATFRIGNSFAGCVAFGLEAERLLHRAIVTLGLLHSEDPSPCCLPLRPVPGLLIESARLASSEQGVELG